MNNPEITFVANIVTSITGATEGNEFEITKEIDEKGVLLTLSIEQEHVGRIIGKQGSTAQSIRTLLRALGSRYDARYSLKVVIRGQEAQ